MTCYKLKTAEGDQICRVECSKKLLNTEPVFYSSVQDSFLGSDSNTDLNMPIDYYCFDPIQASNRTPGRDLSLSPQSNETSTSISLRDSKNSLKGYYYIIS